MKIIVNCPNNTSVISVITTGYLLGQTWADQELRKAKDGLEITVKEPKEDEEQDHE